MWNFFIFWLVLHAVFALYLFIRSLIDPKFAEKLSEINRRERERKARKKAGEISVPCNKWRLATMV